MVHLSPFIPLALLATATVVTIALGAAMLRGTVEDATKLTANLPTRSAKDDTIEAREANRQASLKELRRLLLVRALPGYAVIAAGVVLLGWLCFNQARVYCF